MYNYIMMNTSACYNVITRKNKYVYVEKYGMKRTAKYSDLTKLE